MLKKRFFYYFKGTSASWFWIKRAFKLNKECQLFGFGQTGLSNAGFLVLDETAFQRTQIFRFGRTGLFVEKCRLLGTRIFGFGRTGLFVEERRILGFGRNETPASMFWTNQTFVKDRIY
ncbi:unnamed protein product [Rhizophagus irregularis]|nr:unnamed protein product [Rhizophagus irregularis]